MHAVSYTAGELVDAGKDKIPEIFLTGSHLVYSSPATLAYNSPGAEGFGVKRAGLAIPDSIMLIVSPGCCGRNTSELSSLPDYENRFFYLTLEDADLVTGRHLSRIPKAVEEVVAFLDKKPSLVMICVTCVDALLGTDMDRVCKKAEAAAGVKVRPCYMYALTREGKKPPMVHVRQSLYSLLEPRRKNSRAVNFLGFFAPVIEEFELFSYLKKAGVETIRQISTCDSYEAFEEMAEANFNLVLYPEARAAAEDLSKKLGMPSVELSRFYAPDRVYHQYRALEKILGVSLEDAAEYEAAVKAIEALPKGIKVSVGETMNGDPFELSVMLLQNGIEVLEIFATVTEESYFYLEQIRGLAPDLRVYSNQDPSMVVYAPEEKIDLTIGKDAGWYHPEARHISWNEDRQPYGYAGITALCKTITDTMAGGAK